MVIQEKTVYSIELDSDIWDIAEVIDKFFDELDFQMPPIQARYKKKGVLMERREIAKILAKRIGEYFESLILYDMPVVKNKFGECKNESKY